MNSSNEKVEWALSKGYALNVARIEIPNQNGKNFIARHLVISRDLANGESAEPILPGDKFAYFLQGSTSYYVRRKPGTGFSKADLIQWQSAFSSPSYDVVKCSIDDLLLEKSKNAFLNHQIDARRKALGLLDVLTSRSLFQDKNKQAEPGQPSSESEQSSGSGNNSENGFALESANQDKGQENAKPVNKLNVQDAGEKLPGIRKGFRRNRLTLENVNELDYDACVLYVNKDNIWPEMSAEEAREKGYSAEGYYLYRKMRALLSSTPKLNFNKQSDTRSLHSAVNRLSDPADLFVNYARHIEMAKSWVEVNEPFDKNYFSGDAASCSLPPIMVMQLAEHLGLVKNIEVEHSKYDSGASSIRTYTLLHLSGLDLASLSLLQDACWDAPAYFRRRVVKSFQKLSNAAVKQYAKKQKAESGVYFADIPESAKWDLLYRKGLTAAEETTSDAEEEGSEENDSAATQNRVRIGELAFEGENFRDSKDISSVELLETFGFRGIEFGNWVTQGERQIIINRAYDCFMLLSKALGVQPKVLSLGGRLGLCLGSRGKGRAAAHYSHTLRLINLTRFAGAGTVGHEWGHAVDHYLDELLANKLGRPVKGLRPGAESFLSEKMTTKNKVGRQTFFDVSPLADSNFAHLNEMKFDNGVGGVTALENAVYATQNLLTSLFTRRVSNADWFEAYQKHIEIETDKSLVILREMLKEVGKDHLEFITGVPAANTENMEEGAKQAIHGAPIEWVDGLLSKPEDLEEFIERTSTACFDKPTVIEKLSKFVEKYEAILNAKEWVSENADLKQQYDALDGVKRFAEAPQWEIACKRIGMSTRYRYTTNYSNSAKELDRKRSKPYASTTCEMFARSFESYLTMKLSQMDRRDDFLVTPKSNSPWYDNSPYFEHCVFKRWEVAIKHIADALEADFASLNKDTNVSSSKCGQFNESTIELFNDLLQPS